MNISDLIYLLNKPEATNEKQTIALENVVLQYPYFQAARALHLKGLFNQESFRYNYELKKTAAYTTDRTILFEFITSKNFATIQQEKIDAIQKYILDIVFATRYPEKYRLDSLKPLISFGASPRGSINLALAAKCYAFIKRRGYVIPEDVRAVVHDVLRHRIGITYEAEAENITSEDIINKVLNQVQVP